MTSNVRLATPEDAASAGALLDAFMREFDSPTPGADVLARRLRRLLARRDVLLLLAGPPRALRGLALVCLRPTSFADADAALLEELYVIPAERNRGVGSALLRGAIDEAHARGAGVFEIPVDEGDSDARRFYERHGFTNLVSPDADERMLYYERDLPG